MIIRFRNLMNYTKDIVRKISNPAVKLWIILLLAFTLAGLSEGNVKAAAGLKLYNYSTGKTYTYSDKRVKVTCNGTKIGNSKYPGILVNGIALLPAYDVFDRMPIDTNYSYNDQSGSITITKYKTVIHMTVGSTKATINGKSTLMPVAPMKIKYVAADKMKILIPSRFVSEALGLSYTWYSGTNTVAIVKHSLELSLNGGPKFDYTGSQGKVTIDGESIDVNDTPSIIIDDTAMLNASRVFAESKIKAQYTYNEDDQSITIANGENVLNMTLGSKTATHNNKTITLPAAPVFVYNYETDSSYILVPGYTTATCLGYNYRWNNAIRTSVITMKNSDNNPEPGSQDGVNKVIKQWSGTSSYGKSRGIYELSGSEAYGSTGTIYSVSRDYNNQYLNAETFMIVSNSAFQKVTSLKDGKKLTLHAEAQNCIAQSFQMYQSSSNFVNTISLTNDMNNQAVIDFDILKDNYDYDIALSDNRQTLYVTVYMNTLTSASISTDSKGDYLTLSGLNPISTEVSAGNNQISILLPDTLCSLGYINDEISGSKYIKTFYSVVMPDKTQLVLLMNKGVKYTTDKNGNELKFSFQSEGSSDASDDSENPVEIDKSECQIVIPKPENVTSSMISDEDYYYKNYFEIILEGDYTDFFQNHSIINNSQTVSQISVLDSDGSNTVIKLATSKLQGYEITSDSQNIYVRVGNPRDIYKNIVVLDPGHGGSATGAQKNSTDEKNINLKILYTIGKDYFNQDTSKLKVYYTRTSDVDVSLDDRAAFAKKVGADLFVSLHMNSLDHDTTTSGTEVFYSKLNNGRAQSGLTSMKLASFFDDNIVDALGTVNRGVKEAAFVVIKKNTVPAVLIELGFLTNWSDFSVVTDEDSQNQAVQTIYDTLLQVFEEYPTGR